MKIVFSADICFHYFKEGYPGDDDAASAMKDARALFAGADFSIINLETVFGNAENYKPIFKSGPNLISLPEFKRYIQELSPTAAGLANNHILDFGEEALFDTVRILDELGIKHFGAGTDINEAYEPLKLEKDGEKIAFIAACENEFGVADENKAGCAGYSLGRITAAIRRCKEEGYAPVIFFHGGCEYNPLPTTKKKELYRHFVDIGACAVIAMHTHCPQGYEIYDGAPIIYSMGNFYFPLPPAKNGKRAAVWYYGYTTALTFNGGDITTEIMPYKQDFDGIRFLRGDELEHFYSYIEAISAPIADDALLQKYFDAWCLKRNSMPVFADKINAPEGNEAHIRNTLCCEAHNEVLTNEARLVYDGVDDDISSYVADIEILNDMMIPNSLIK